MIKHFRQGFTLIELLVVIAVIGLLSSVVMVSLNKSRAAARDAQRKTDLLRLQAAIEAYKFDKGSYPLATPVCNPGINAFNDNWCRDTTDNSGSTKIEDWIPGLSAYMTVLPHNPKPYASGYWPYHYHSDGNSYWLMVGLENLTPDTCGGGSVYLWIDNVNNACNWWGTNLYVRSSKYR